ncbi:hypothetical protein FJZ33_12865, partial [Candidatus Poribacteria bacterium]|nr:hypothetical protein [Candidatus Poribacteria bacterium]
MDEQITFSRDSKVDVWVNQVGFTPDAWKICVMPISEENKFHVIQLESGNEVFCDNINESDGDFGRFGIGNFSMLKTSGTYYIKTGSHRSFPFRINSN